MVSGYQKIMDKIKCKILIALILVTILSIAGCKNNNESIVSTNVKKLTFGKSTEDKKPQKEPNYITKDSIFYLMDFDKMEIDSFGQFSIADKEYNVLDVTKLRLGADSNIDWEQEKFPENVLKFKNAEYLWMGMRGFREIPIGLGEFKNLRHLDLQHGNIRKLPADFYQLENLETLTLLFSNINELPVNFERLKNLKDLNLACTQIKNIPNQIAKMENLKSLLLSHNDECEGKRKVFTKNDEMEIRRILTNTKVRIGQETDQLIN